MSNFGKLNPSSRHQLAQLGFSHPPAPPQPSIQPNQLEAMKKAPKLKRGGGFWKNMVSNYWKDMGVCQVRRRFDLSKESLCTQRLSQLWIEDLDRNHPVMFQILGQIDRGHPAATDLPLDLIAVSECSLQAFLVFHVA